MAAFLKTAEVAARLGVSTRTLARWAKEGKGPPAVRIQRRTRITRVRLKDRKGKTSEHELCQEVATIRYPEDRLDAWIARQSRLGEEE